MKCHLFAAAALTMSILVVRVLGTITPAQNVRSLRVAGAPAIVTITGSGQQDRDERLMGVDGCRPFWQAADKLARRGITPPPIHR